MFTCPACKNPKVNSESWLCDPKTGCMNGPGCDKPQPSVKPLPMAAWGHMHYKCGHCGHEWTMDGGGMILD